MVKCQRIMAQVGCLQNINNGELFGVKDIDGNVIIVVLTFLLILVIKKKV